MSVNFTEKQIRGWQNGADGFFAWLEDIKPMVPSFRGGFELFKPAEFQIQTIRDALQQDDKGNWKYQTIVFSFPRRHSKTTLMALLVLWRFTTRHTQNIICLASSERQSISTGFTIVSNIAKNTPAINKMLDGGYNIQKEQILYPALQNKIKAISNSVASIYGEKITIAWVTELHAMSSDNSYQVLASSLGDTLNSWMLVDSTVDSMGGSLHRLEKLAESGEDPTIFVKRLEYADLEEALEKSPSWIRRDWLKSRKTQLLPAEFASQHLNQRLESSSCLFASADIEACMERLPLPVVIDSLKTYAAGRTWQAGGGLDRAYFASLHGDKTIWSSVAKIAGSDGGEAHYLVLNQKSILGSLASGIKKAILEDNEQYNLHNVAIEAYNSQDIAIWTQERGIPTEIIHATTQAQIPAFMEFHRIVREHRLHFSDKLSELASEMRTFMYELVNGTPRFGCDKFHDDRVYSLAWAIFALRQSELAAYSIPNIVCESKSLHTDFCYLRGGDSIMACSRNCPTHIQVNAMYLQYKKNNIESHISVPEFFENLVKNCGSKIYIYG